VVDEADNSITDVTLDPVVWLDADVELSKVNCCW